jgi:hypothetical protein
VYYCALRNNGDKCPAILNGYPVPRYKKAILLGFLRGQQFFFMKRRAAFAFPEQVGYDIRIGLIICPIMYF